MATVVSQSISDIDIKLLQYKIYDVDNKDNPATKWIDGAITGKINNCYKNMQTEWIPKLMADSNVAAISASKEDFVNQVTGHSTYSNRWASVSASAASDGTTFS